MSSKRKDAEYYQQHKDDPEEYGEPQGTLGKRPERRRLNAMVSVRLTPDEEALIRSVAERHKLSLSAFLRMTALKAAAPNAPVDIERWRQTKSTTASSTTRVDNGNIVMFQPATGSHGEPIAK